ncbi:AIPR family protein [Maricaulis maris]|uniref:AIPR family protein n=1 Tax=Maricaulis maris TaxID=74318 RepID=UPI003A9018D7
MNPVIKAQLSNYATSASLQQLSESDQFEVYTVFSVLCGLLGESVDPVDVHLQGCEFGTDGVAILLQGELVRNADEVAEKLEYVTNPSIDFVFFQSKTGAGFDYGDVSKFFDSIKEFFSGGMAGESEQLDDLIAAMNVVYARGVGRKNPSIRAYYATTGNYDEPRRIERLRENFLTEMSDLNIFDRDAIEANFVGAAQLQNCYRAATTSAEVEIDFPRNVVMPDNDKVDEAYIGYLTADQLSKLFIIRGEDGSVVGVNKSVFFDNIRDYNPKSDINIEIKKSVSELGGGDFIFKNNGITVVAKSTKRTGDRFKIEDFQIVNGCQTSNIIFDLLYGPDATFQETEKLSAEISVPFRLIGSKHNDFVGSIIIGTNRQNPVKAEQFWALRPFMKSFEEYASSTSADEVIYFERRENQYRGQDVERVRIVQPSTMMKALAAVVLYQPHRAGRDYRGIVSEYEKKLFHDDHDVRIYHAACYLHYRIEFLWRNQRLNTDLKVYRFYILTAIGLVVTQGENLFSLKASKVEKVVGKLLDIAKDELLFCDIAVKASNMVRKVQSKIGPVSSDKARDTLRNEAVANQFKSDWQHYASENLDEWFYRS